MPIYEYKNDRGEVFEIVASMKAPPPELVTVFEGGEWEPTPTYLGVPMLKSRRGGEENEATAARRIFRRVYAGGLAVSVPEHGITYKGPPASRSLPRRKGGKLDKLAGHDVKRHKDGGYTTLDGKPIIQNKADAEREMKRTGHDRL